MMHAYVNEALKRIDQWLAEGAPPETAVKVELQAMYVAGYTDALKSKRNSEAFDRWIAENENSGYQAEDMGTGWNRSKDNAREREKVFSE